MFQHDNVAMKGAKRGDVQFKPYPFPVPLNSRIIFCDYRNARPFSLDLESSKALSKRTVSLACDEASRRGLD
jgi:hypothetical protein